ncbi:MAG: DUF4258 domain-containing protein, partial [Candidatus Micrarchaeota archaeon]|nr:DUF4258 domain-containing protein [Candidatus Micrarchaeota archaeon]
EYLFGKHALERMAERKIEKSEVKNTVEKGQKWLSEADGRWHAKMAGIEVVFEKREKDTLIVTCFFEK